MKFNGGRKYISDSQNQGAAIDFKFQLAAVLATMYSGAQVFQQSYSSLKFPIQTIPSQFATALAKSTFPFVCLHPCCRKLGARCMADLTICIEIP